MFSDKKPFPPVIDLSADDAASAVDRACRSVGFFQVVEHGIPRSTIVGAFTEIDRFFALPTEAKMEWRSPNREIERGYTARGTEGLSYSLGLDRPPDLFESFTMGDDDYPLGDPVYADDRHNFFAPNIWPDSPETLRPALVAYYAEVRALAHRLTLLFTVALGLDADFFEARTSHSLDTLRVNYFEGLPGEPLLPNQFGIGPHTDFGILTVLLTDDVPGLQVLGPDGGWRDVAPVPGALIVNVGDLLAQWTNDHWRSTLHQVQAVRPQVGRPVRRRSLPFFHEGDFDTVVECLPTCQSPDNPSRYPAVVAGEHVLAKVLSARMMTAGDARSTLGERGESIGGPAAKGRRSLSSSS